MRNRVMLQLIQSLRACLGPVLAVIAGLSVGLCITAISGENPLNVARILVLSAFGSKYDLGMTLFYATPLIFTGLSVAVAFRSGLFNIGAEGQLTLGALAVGAVGMLFPGVPAPLAPLLGILAAIVVGGFWGWVPGWLRAKRGSHEVINTIMLNFVAAGIASYFTIYWLDNPDSQNPETAPVGAGYLFAHYPQWFGEAPVSIALPLALLCALGVGFLFKRTVWGYEIEAVGQNENAARAAGINAGRVRIFAMALAGALAGMVGVAEVLGNAGKFRMGFSPDYGFIGIAVALLGRNHPVGVIAAALLFGALHKGAGDLDFETETVTRDLSLVLQALVILSVSAEALWARFRTGRSAKNGVA